MEGMTWIWLILAVVVIVAGAVVLTGRQRKTKQADRAESLRSEASEQADLVRQREAKAAEVDAKARVAQAEADAKAAEAEGLALTAERQKAEAATHRAEVDDQFRKADEIDPHYDNTHAEEGIATDTSGQASPQGSNTTDDRDRETPR